MIKWWQIWLVGVAGFASSCSSTDTEHVRLNAPLCVEATINSLGADPARYEGRRVCVSGFFGRIEPYGETRFELFTSRAEAETGHADLSLDLGIRWDVMLQVRLSRHSAEFVRVEGVFEYDPQCWPPARQIESDFRCSPPRPMRLRNVRLQFRDGTEYRHPDFP